MSDLDGRCPDCGVVDGCICGPDDGPLVIPCLRPAGECRDAIATLTSERDEARRMLGEVARMAEMWKRRAEQHGCNVNGGDPECG